MAHERSPNYPGSNLRVAIGDAHTIYDREGRSAFPMEIGAKALGYTSLNGTTRVRLAALRQYGLLVQQKGESNARLTNEALTLVLRTEETREYQDALKHAALVPPLFAELYETHLDASDESLRHHLIVNKHFTNDGAKRCVEIFRATMQLAHLANPDMISGHDDEKIPLEMEGDMDSHAQAKYDERRDKEPDKSQTLRCRWVLSKNVTADVTFTGGDITPHDVQMLRAYIILMERALQDRDAADIFAGTDEALPALLTAESIIDVPAR